MPLQITNLGSPEAVPVGPKDGRDKSESVANNTDSRRECDHLSAAGTQLRINFRKA
jgi:hypothetical protein